MRSRYRDASVVLLVAALGLGGCTMPQSNVAIVSSSQARKIQTVQMGTVQSVTPCVIEGDTGPNYSLGRRAGASAGQMIGFGVPPGVALAGAAGAVAGGVIGEQLEKSLTSKAGQVIEIVLDDGRHIAIAQEAEPPFFGNERVKVMIVGDEAHVVLAEDQTTSM